MHTPADIRVVDIPAEDSPVEDSRLEEARNGLEEDTGLVQKDKVLPQGEEGLADYSSPFEAPADSVAAVGSGNHTGRGQANFACSAHMARASRRMPAVAGEAAHR